MYRPLGRAALSTLILLASSLPASVAQGGSGPRLEVTFLRLSTSQASVRETVSLSAIVTNVGEDTAVDVTLGVTSTTSDVDVLAQAPSSHIASLKPGTSIAFAAVVRIKEEGSFELGLSGLGTNVMLDPQTKPIVVGPAVKPSQPGNVVNWLWLPLASLVGAPLVAYRVRRKWTSRIHALSG